MNHKNIRKKVISRGMVFTYKSNTHLVYMWPSLSLGYNLYEELNTETNVNRLRFDNKYLERAPEFDEKARKILDTNNRYLWNNHFKHKPYSSCSPSHPDGKRPPKSLGRGMVFTDQSNTNLVYMGPSLKKGYHLYEELEPPHNLYKLTFNNQFLKRTPEFEEKAKKILKSNNNYIGYRLLKRRKNTF